MAEPAIPLAAFVDRFVAHMLRHAGPTFDDGTSIESHAREIAPFYWRHGDKWGTGAESPEECAEADMSYWGED